MTQDKNAEVALMHSEIQAGSWEDTAQQLKPRRKLVELLRPFLRDGQLVLDAGCGPGTYGLILASEGNYVIGLDISIEAVAIGMGKAKKSGATFSPLAGDLERMPFLEGTFDVCFCAYSLHHFPDVTVPMIELARVLKSGGKIILVEPNGSNPGVKLSQLAEFLVRPVLNRLRLDSSNEALHGCGYYVKALRREGLAEVVSYSHYFGGLPPLPRMYGGINPVAHIVRFLAHVRRIMYIILSKTLPQPYNGADLLVVGTKR